VSYNRVSYVTYKSLIRVNNMSLGCYRVDWISNSWEFWSQNHPKFWALKISAQFPGVIPQILFDTENLGWYWLPKYSLSQIGWHRILRLFPKLFRSKPESVTLSVANSRKKKVMAPHRALKGLLHLDGTALWWFRPQDFKSRPRRFECRHDRCWAR